MSNEQVMFFPSGDENDWPRQATIKALERGWQFTGDATETVVVCLPTCQDQTEAFLLGMWAMNLALKKQQDQE